MVKDDIKEILLGKLGRSNSVKFKTDKGLKLFVSQLTNEIMNIVGEVESAEPVETPVKEEVVEAPVETEDKSVKTENTNDEFNRRRSAGSVIQINEKPSKRGATVMTEGKSQTGDSQYQ